jgi:hypothetical protein
VRCGNWLNGFLQMMEVTRGRVPSACAPSRRGGTHSCPPPRPQEDRYVEGQGGVVMWQLWRVCPHASWYGASVSPTDPSADCVQFAPPSVRRRRTSFFSRVSLRAPLFSLGGLCTYEAGRSVRSSRLRPRPAPRLPGVRQALGRHVRGARRGRRRRLSHHRAASMQPAKDGGANRTTRPTGSRRPSSAMCRLQKPRRKPSECLGAGGTGSPVPAIRSFICIASSTVRIRRFS